MSIGRRRQSEPVLRIQPNHKLDDLVQTEWKVKQNRTRKKGDQQSTGAMTAVTDTFYGTDLAETWNHLESAFGNSSGRSVFIQERNNAETIQKRLQAFHEHQSVPLQRLKELLLSSVGYENSRVVNLYYM